MVRNMSVMYSSLGEWSCSTILRPGYLHTGPSAPLSSADYIPGRPMFGLWLHLQVP